MKDITKYLIYDTARYGEKDPHFEVKFKIEINQIDQNPYHLPIDYIYLTREKLGFDQTNMGDKQKHWEMSLIPCTRDKEEEGSEWHEDVDQKLKFKLTTYGTPTIEDFSNAIYKELNAVLNAIGVTEEDWVWDIQQKMLGSYKEFTPQQVFKFIKNLHYGFDKTDKFLDVYDFFYERMHQSMKFAMYLLEGNRAMFTMSYDYPIGEHLTAFLEVGKYYDHYE